MENILILTSLKNKLINYYKAHDFENKTNYLHIYLQTLENLYYFRSNSSHMCVNAIKNKVREYSQQVTNKNCSEENEIQFINEIDDVLCNIKNVELLMELLFFFEPELHIKNISSVSV